jgi:hypothetical protein
MRDSSDTRCLSAPTALSLVTMKRLFMDSEARLVPPRPRWTRCCGSSTWEGISGSPGPHQQEKPIAMSGHIVTTSDQNVEVLGTQFSLDAAPSSVNMITDLGLSQSCLMCPLTKAACSCITSPGEGSSDRQSLFGRSDWWEQIANPSPLGRQGDSRAKWVGQTGFYRSSGVTAFVECSSAVHSKTSEIGVSDAPTGRRDTRGRSVGAFSSVRRAGCLYITNGHAENRLRDIRQGWLGCRANLSASSTGVQARRMMSLQPPAAAFSDAERARSRSTRCCGSDREMSCPVLSDGTNKDSLLGSKQGTSWVPGTNQGPIEFLGKATRPHVVFGPVASNRETDARTRPVSIHRCCGSARRDIAARPVRPAPTGTSPMGAPWQQTGTLVGSLVKAT